MNGQPVWVLHDGSKDIFGQQHKAGVYRAIFLWDTEVAASYPFCWEIPLGVANLKGGLYDNRLWMPRLDNEMPEPPPAEKPKAT